MPKAKQLDYDAAFRRLEEIADILEQGDQPLEQNLKLFEEGAGLAAQLNKTLEAAEQKLIQLNAAGEEEPADV
jgi:exodeoxyribonuclease VII small subunit